MSLHALANAQDFADIGVAQRPVVAIAALGVVVTIREKVEILKLLILGAFPPINC
jgi:hypothetical protein